MIDDRDRNKDSDCAGLVKALSGAIMLFAFIVHSFLTIGVLIVWALGEAALARPHRPYQKPLTLDEAYRATGREPPSLGFSGAKPPFVKVVQGAAALIATLIVAAAIAGIIARGQPFGSCRNLPLDHRLVDPGLCRVLGGAVASCLRSNRRLVPGRLNRRAQAR